MNHHIRKRNDTFIAMKAFRIEFPADFPAGSEASGQMDEIDAAIELIAQYGGDQALGVGNVRFNFNSKSIARDHLREELNDLSDIAGTYAYTIPGIDLLFHIPKNLPDASLLALAQSFAAQAVQYKEEFTKRGLETAFIENLQAASEDFEQSLTPPEAAQDTQVEATAKLDEAVRRGMIARNILKAILKLKYKNNPSRMRVWLSASHLEREGKPDKPDAPKP